MQTHYIVRHCVINKWNKISKMQLRVKKGRSGFKLGIMSVQLCSAIADSYIRLRSAGPGVRGTPQSFV
jgi:hypothetical protein